MRPIQKAQRAAGSVVVGVEVGAVGALQCGHVFVVAAEHVGRAGQELEIVRAERRGAIGVRERLVGVDPRVLRIGLAASLDRSGGSHAGETAVPSESAARNFGAPSS